MNGSVSVERYVGIFMLRIILDSASVSSEKRGCKEL